MYAGRYSHTEIITDLYKKLPGKSHRGLVEDKVDGGTKRCVLPLRVYRRKFPNNVTANGLPKLDAFQSVTPHTRSLHRRDPPCI